MNDFTSRTSEQQGILALSRQLKLAELMKRIEELEAELVKVKASKVSEWFVDREEIRKWQDALHELQDLRNAAEEGFNEWWPSVGQTIGQVAAKLAWNASRLPLVKENAELRKALDWCLGTLANAAEIMDTLAPDAEDETAEVKVNVAVYRAQFKL